MATNIQTLVATKTGTAMPGSAAKTWNSPGAAANPMVRSSSPKVEVVCRPGSTQVPIWKVIIAHASHVTSAITLTSAKRDGSGVHTPPAPSPAARLASRTVNAA